MSILDVFVKSVFLLYFFTMQNPIEEKHSLTVVGIDIRTANDPDKAPIDIPQMWQRFYAENIFEKIPNKASTDIVALYCDYESDYMAPYTFVLGCFINELPKELPEGLVIKTLPASQYVVYKAKGKQPDALIDAWGKIWREADRRSYTGDFEIYGSRYFGQPEQEVDIFIAIQ